MCPGSGPEIEKPGTTPHVPLAPPFVLNEDPRSILLGPAKLTWKWFQGEADKQISELTPSNTSRLSGGLVGTASPLQGTTTS